MEKTREEGDAVGCKICFLSDSSEGERGSIVSTHLDKTERELRGTR